MSDVHQPGKERPARPPKPAKPQQPATSDIPSSPPDTESQNQAKPAAPPKPKKPPTKKLKGSKTIASSSQEVTTESDESGSADSNRADSVKSIGSPSGSPKVPPRKHKKPSTKQSSGKNNLESGKVQINGNSEINSSEVAEEPTSEPNSEDRQSTRLKPPPPTKLMRQDLVEEECSDPEKCEERLENGNANEVPADDRLKAFGSDELDGGIVDTSTGGDSPSVNVDGNLAGGKKVPLKPKPSRPPPPQKRPSQLSREDSSVTNNLQQSPQTKPKPLKPQKFPALKERTSSSPAKSQSWTEVSEKEAASEDVEDGEVLDISVGGPGKSTPGSTGTSNPHRPPRKRDSLDMSTSKDEKSMDDKHEMGIEAQTIVEDQHQKELNTSMETKKPKPKRPLPLPKAKLRDTSGLPGAKSPASTGNAKPTSPQIPVDEKRRSNGSMFAVIGTVHANGQVAEEAVNKSTSQLESRDAPVSREGEIKPHRPAPKKPPPPNPALVKQRSTIKESPTSSPVHKKNAGASPRRQDSQRPPGPPPPPPPTKMDTVEKVGSIKTPPKRPPPVHKKPVASSTPMKEDAQVESSKVDTEINTSNEEVASDRLSSSEGQAEPIEEGESNGPVILRVPSITVVQEDEVTTPTGGAPVGPDDVFGGDGRLKDKHQRDSQLSGEDLDSSFDDFSEDEFSDGATPGGSGETEEPSDAAFMDSLPKMQKKAYQVAKEIRDSEGVFVDVLKLLNEDFKNHVIFARGPDDQEIEESVLTEILGYLPNLQMFNEELYNDLVDRINKWPENPKVADVFIKKGPFLKVYTTYFQNFEKQTAALDSACHRYPHFKGAVKEFEATARCQSLHISHYMLKPVQRIPQYRLLLTDYQKTLEEGSVDEEDTKEALKIVSSVAKHVNEFMKKGDDFNKLLDIQHSLIGQHHIVQPGRTFIKEGILHKISRKEFQQRKMFLLSDILLMTAATPAGLTVRRKLPLAGMRVEEPTQIKDHENEFNIISVEKSCTLAASSPEEKEDWMTAINDALVAVRSKNKSFNMNDENTVDVDGKFGLGSQAPVWIPDRRVTMCMICTAEFTLTFRRHHCRACGHIVCGECSPSKAWLEYLGKKDRVCVECNKVFGTEDESTVKVKRKKSHINSPKPVTVLTEVKATEDKDITMKGYLDVKDKRKFKKMWFVVKDMVLYQYKASEDVKALETFPLPGFEVTSKNGEIQLTQNTKTLIFKTNEASSEQWMEAFKKAALIE